MTLKVGIYLFDEVEVLDFAGPYEVFSTASRVAGRLWPGELAPFTVFTAAETRQVRARGGLLVTPDYDLRGHPPIDVLIVPGGLVSEELEKNSVISWILMTSRSSVLTASVCTGSFLLARAGLLEGKKATTHWEDINDFKELFPDTIVHENVRWVDEGRIVTSAGISAGIDMSLHLIARLKGEDLALGTARQMEFDWNRSGMQADR